MNETTFRNLFLDKLVSSFPGLVVIKADSTFIQGIPDRFLLYEDRWAALEFKRASNSSKRANQDFYINSFNQMSYASFVFPENQSEVLRGIQRAFRS